MKNIIIDNEEYPYTIDKNGNVFNKKSLKLSPGDNGAGYLYLNLVKNGTKKRMYIHRLVALMYIPNPRNLPQVNHKDGDKSNNHVSNLEWSCGSKNIRHAHKSGFMEKRKNLGKCREYNERDVADIYYKVKILGQTISSLSEEYNIPRTTISSYINKRSHVELTDFIDEIA